MLIKGDWESAIKHGFATRNNAGIGTYSEKNVHRILKLYFEPDARYHEVKCGKLVADISNENGIIEVQTRAFNNLTKKLDAFLPLGNVTVVYAYPALKWLCWLDPDTGEITKKRRSTKRYTPCDAFYELYKIKKYLHEENLHFCLLGLEMEEIRLLNGWSNDKKRGSTRYERNPVKVIEILEIHSAADYKKMLPNTLPPVFTLKDLSSHARLSQKASSLAFRCLKELGVIEKCGQEGRKYLYKIV